MPILTTLSKLNPLAKGARLINQYMKEAVVPAAKTAGSFLSKVGNKAAEVERSVADKLVLPVVKASAAVGEVEKKIATNPLKSLRAVGEFVAPETTKRVVEAKTTGQQIAAGASIVPGVALEAVARPAARTLTSLAKEPVVQKLVPLSRIAERLSPGATDRAIKTVTEMPQSRFVLGDEPVKKFSEVAGEGGKTVQTLAEAAAKNAGVGLLGQKVAGAGGYGLGFLGFGGLELTNLDLGVGGVAKKGLREGAEVLTKRMIESAEKRIGRNLRTDEIEQITKLAVGTLKESSNRMPDIKINLRSYYENKVKPLASGSLTKRETVPVGILPEGLSKNIGAQRQQVDISNRSLKHIEEQRPKIVKNVVNVLPETVSNPDRVARNIEKTGEVRPGSFVMTKRAGENYSSVLDANKNEITTAFTGPERSINKYPEIKNQPSGGPALPTSPLTPFKESAPFRAVQDAEAGRFPKEPISALRSADSAKTIAESTSGVKPSVSSFDANQYVREMTSARESARGTEQGFKAKLYGLTKEIKKKLVDFASPIEDALAEVSKKHNFEVLPKFDITHQIDRVLRSPTLAGQFAEDNGITDVIRSVGDLDALDQYLIAKHSATLEARGIKTGRNAAKDAALVQELTPAYDDAAKTITQYSSKLLDYSVESGLIDAKLAAELRKLYPDYVPMNRIFDEIEHVERGGKNRALASISSQSVVRRLEGSTREIESPVASLLAKTNDAFTQGERNKAARILAGYKDLPDFPMRELKPGETAQYTISYLDAGKKRTFETTADIAAAAKQLNVQQLGLLGKIFAFPTRIAKAGITGLNIPFTLSNIMRDQIFTAITSERALKTSIANPAVFVKSLFSAVTHNDLYKEMVRMGASGTSFDVARNQVFETIGQIRSTKSLASRAKYIATNPKELLRHVEDIISTSEEVTRLQQYEGMKRALLAEGRTMEDAMMLAAKASRKNSTDFLRRGEWGQVLNSAFLYLNANIQGVRAFARVARARPKMTAAKVALTIYAPVAITTAWNLNDPERKAAYEDITQKEKEDNLIIIPPNPTKDENGRWNVIKIPLPPGVNQLAIPVRKSLEGASGLDSVRFGDFAQAIIGAVSPLNVDVRDAEATKRSLLSTLTPQAIRPSVEAMTNTRLYSGTPIVPMSLEKLSPEMQYKEKTSGTARLVGQKLGLSPLKVEEFIRGTFGGVGSQVLNAVDTGAAAAGIIPKDQIGGESIMSGLTRRFSQAYGGESDRATDNELRDRLQKQADDRFALKVEAEALDNELLKLPKEVSLKRALDVKRKNPDLYNKLVEVSQERKLGLTYAEKQIKLLGVENGERARFIYSLVMKETSKEERRRIVKDLRAKKIITDRVTEQLNKISARSSQNLTQK